MSARKHLQKFLSSFDAKNQIHSRVLGMLVQSAGDTGELDDIADLLPPGTADSLDRPAASATEATFQKQGTTQTFEAFDRQNGTPSADHTGAVPAPPPSADPLPSKRPPSDGPSLRPGEQPPPPLRSPKRAHRDEPSDIPGIPGLGSPEETAGPHGAAVSPARGRAPVHRTAAEQPPSATTRQARREEDPSNIFNKSVYEPMNPARQGLPVTPVSPAYLFLPLQCKLCGLRYREDMTEEFGTHIEDHRRKNRALDDRAVVRREFFTSKKAKAAVRLTLPQIESRTEHIPWSREEPVCAVCSEAIRKAWSDELDEWILDGGIRASDEEFIHKTCAP